MMPSIAAMFHQLSLLCRQHCACDCMTKHALPSMLQHNTCTLTVLMLHSNNFTSHKMTFLLRFSFWPAKRIPWRCISLHKGQVLPPPVSYFSLFDSNAQLKRLEDPSQFNLDKVKACCLSVAYQLILLAVSIHPATTSSGPLSHQHWLSSSVRNRV